MGVVEEKVTFEEALDKTGFGRYNVTIMLLCNAMVMAMVFESLSMSILVPASACELGTTNAQQGLLAGMPMIGVIATSHVWGFLADTKGRRPILIISLLLGFSTASLSAFSPNWIVLSVLKIVSCSSVSGTFSLAMTMLSECTPQAKRSSMLILSTSFFMVANGIMAVLAIPILPLTFSYYIPVLNIHFNSWRLLGIVFAVPCALGAFGIWTTWESPKYLISVGKEEEALNVLRNIYAINNRKEEKEYQVKSIVLDETSVAPKGSMWSSILSQTLPILKPPLLKNTIILSLMYGVIYFCVNPFMVWLPTVADGLVNAVERGETNITLCSMLRSSQNATVVNNQCSLNPYAMLMVCCTSLILASCNVITGTLVSLYGRRRVLIIIQVFVGVCGLCINLSSNWIVSTILFIIYIFAALNFGLITSFTVDMYPTYLRAMAVCMTVMVGRVSSIVGVNILKMMLVSMCETSFYLFSSLTIAGAAFSLLLPKDQK